MRASSGRLNKTIPILLYFIGAVLPLDATSSALWEHIHAQLNPDGGNLAMIQTRAALTYTNPQARSDWDLRWRISAPARRACQSPP